MKPTPNVQNQSAKKIHYHVNKQILVEVNNTEAINKTSHLPIAEIEGIAAGINNYDTDKKLDKLCNMSHKKCYEKNVKSKKVLLSMSNGINLCRDEFDYKLMKHTRIRNQIENNLYLVIK